MNVLCPSKTIMTTWMAFSFILALIGGIGLPASHQSGQVKPGQLISAKAGMVTRVEGKAVLQAAAGKTPKPVEPSLQMMDGDSLRTENGGRVELLVHPDAFLRLGELTEIGALNTDLSGARFELHGGLLIVEVAKTGEGFPFEIVSRHGALTIRSAGLYQINIEPSCLRVDVLKGEIELGSKIGKNNQGPSRISGSKRVELRNTAENAVTIIGLVQKPYDERDSWSFPVSKFGALAHCEGNVFTFCSNSAQRCRVSTGFQIKEDAWLLLEDVGSATLRIDPAEHLSLGPHAQLHAVKTEGDDAVFELSHGPAIAITEVPTSPLYPGLRGGRGFAGPPRQIRPMKIITPHGTFALTSSTVARLDVTPQATEISVRKGRVIAERRGGAAADRTWNIDQGQRIRLEVDAAKPVRNAPFNRDAMDTFDRWALGLLVAGYVSRVDGRVMVERRAGGSLERTIGVQGVQLEEGDRLVTTVGGRVQLRLNSFTSLYVDETSEIRMTSVDKAVQRLELLRGAIFLFRLSRPATFTKIGPPIEVAAPQGSVNISKSGEYRIDAGKSGTRIAVESGYLLFSPRSTAGISAKIKLKEGEVAFFPAKESGQPQILKHVNLAPDRFDDWIKSR
jgi:hypothetical protein